jgi:hypothetical protein
MTSQESAEAGLSKQVAALISQIESIEGDESLEPEEQIDELLSLGGDVLKLAQLAIPAEQQLAKVLLSSYVNATPWFEADYGIEGFYHEHEVCSELLFRLGQNLPTELIPESFDSEKNNFSYCAGLSMNSNVTSDKLGRFRASAINYGYGWDEDVVLFVALLLNPNSTADFVIESIEQLSVDQVDWLLGLITGHPVVWGNSSEYTQELIMDASHSVEALTAIKHYVESNTDSAFNQSTDWSELLVKNPSRALEAIEVRLASKNPRFHHFENN